MHMPSETHAHTHLSYRTGTHIHSRLNHERRLLISGSTGQATTLALGLTTIMRQKNYGNGIFRFI